MQILNTAKSKDRDVRDVVIIGAGLSGLSAAQALRSRGIDSLILEKEQCVAGPWRARHPQLHLNTHRRLSSLPDHPLPDHGPAFPSRDEIIAYLASYADATQANIRYGATVQELDRTGDEWVLQTNTGPVRARNVIFATGKEREPAIPPWPGSREWQGQLIHSAALGDVSRFAGKRVLVVGAGNSGIDVLNHLAKVPTKSLHVAIRDGGVIAPTWLLGFPVHLGSPVMDLMPNWLVDRLLAVTERLAFGNLHRFGFPTRKGGASRLYEEGVSPGIDNGFVPALKAGKARVTGPVVRFKKDAVVFEDGERLQPEIVIAATGYHTGLHTILGKFELLNDRGLPRTNAKGEAIGLPGLWFAGFSTKMTGYFWAAKQNSAPMAKAIGKRLAATARSKSANIDALGGGTVSALPAE